jgi:metallophosphoesterase superfamily enzyme
MAIRGRDSVANEISDVGYFLEQLKRPDHKVIVVESNHDIGLERYVREGATATTA